MPNPTILGCSPCFLLSCCSPADRIIFDWPQRRSSENSQEDKSIARFHSDRELHAIGWFHWPRWSADGKAAFDPLLFSRDTLSKSINCKQPEYYISLRNPKPFRTFEPFKFSNARFFYPYKQWENFRTRPSFVR